MNKVKLGAAALVLGLSATTATVGADPQSLYQPCAACHGEAGQGNTELKAPALAGQGQAYLERQLRHFRAGIRGADPQDALGAQMRPMAAMLGDDDITVLATWLAGLQSAAVADPQQGDLRNGNNFYQSKCGACHGGRAEGNPSLNAPALSLLGSAYIQRQYQNFQRGLRGAHPEDTYGRQMKMMATSLPDDQALTDVIAFIHTLGAAGSK